MFHVRQGRGKFVPGVHRADARGRGAPQGPRRAGTETVLLPSDDPLPCGTHRRSVAVRLKDLAPRRRTRGEGFLGLQSFERFRWVRGVAWFERGGRLVFPLTRNPTSLGCWRLRFKSGRTHLTSGSKPISGTSPIPDRWFKSARRGDEGPSLRSCGRTQQSDGGTGTWRAAPRSRRTSISDDSGTSARPGRSGRTTSFV